MPVVLSPSEASEAFRPVGAAGRPIYRQDCAGYAVFYAPGYLCVVGLVDADRFESAIRVRETRFLGKPVFLEQEADCVAELWRYAERALAGAASLQDVQDEPFRPECLTLYMNNECNLGCVYCHTDPSPRPATKLELEAISAAAEVVAENCRRKGRPLYAVFHGGGEPTLHRERVDRAMEKLEEVASRHGVEMYRYVATNGAMSEDKARWMAHRFDLVGLSCDGPADIQDRQRPLWGGGCSSQVVERTAHVLREEGRAFHARTTITAATLHRQAEIADYLCQQLSPDEIHFEPVYVGGRTTSVTGLGAHQAGAFVAGLMEAREIARRYGILLTTSGSRPGEIHGPYCHVFRSVLNLVPGGVATACFKVTEAAQVEAKGAAIGAFDGEAGRFQVDYSHVHELRQQLDVYLPECADCFNRFHCVRECPDLCPLDGDVRQNRNVWKPGFRCHAQKALAHAILREAADRLWADALEGRKEAERGDASADTGPIIRGTRIL